MRQNRVVMESPYAGDVEKNVAYARRCLYDCLKRGEAPIASHLLFPGVLDDALPDQRRVGIESGHAWIGVADMVVVYTDLGVSKGMQAAIDLAGFIGTPVVYRELQP